MKILSIDTSCDETSVAVTSGRKILANSVYSQILIHRKWGGVVPSLAKRAHEKRINLVVDEALKKGKIKNPKKEIDYLAVTYGPGLAIALEVGVKKIKELSLKWNKKIISINHLEGHIYSIFAQNKKGNPKRIFQFPYLVLIVSGGHTELVLFKDQLQYQVIGKTLDDAVGEGLDKAAKILGFGYPGGEIIESLAEEVGGKDFHHFPRPMVRTDSLDFSFSGLKTAFYYFVKKLGDKERNKSLKELASSFQEASFDSLTSKLKLAMERTKIKNILVVGGVSINRRLRKKIRNHIKEKKGKVLFPYFKKLNGDNAAMIGIAAYYRAKKKAFVSNLNDLDREPRANL